MALPSHFSHFHHRFLQFQLPDYTSPPLPDALAATPEAFRDDAVIDDMRDLAAAGNCTGMNCHIPFIPENITIDDDDNSTGIIFYGGALVDPRAYSVLAEPLSMEYNLTVLIPVFEADIAFPFGTCGPDRFELLQGAYPEIDEWLLVGHSLGGTAAVADTWTALEDDDGFSVSSELAGLVLLASDVQPGVCGPFGSSSSPIIDFSMTDLPMGAVIASEDEILNLTRWEQNTEYLSNNTLFELIDGGNHAQFGSYNDTLRTPILGQVDGMPTIPPQQQWDIIVETILAVLGMAEKQ